MSNPIATTCDPVPASRHDGVTGATAAPTDFRKLRILYNHRTQSRDGQSVHIQELISAFRRLGHEVLVIEPAHAAAAKFGEEPRAARAAKKFLPKQLYELAELAYSAYELGRLVAACRRFRPDFLYQRANLFMLSGIFMRRVLGVPLLLEVNSPLAEERGRYGNLKFRRMAQASEEAAWRAADMVLPVTHVLARRIERAGVPAGRIAVLPNGVDLNEFTRRPDTATALRRRLDLEGRFILGFTGFVREWHHADKIVSLLADATLPPEAHFLIVGDGPVAQDLREQARRLGVEERVTITGIVGRDAVADYVQCFDIALQPHVVPYASPLKLLEYMALARPIIAPDSENIRELLAPEECALLFASGDAAALVAAIRRLAGDERLRRRLGQAARKVVIDRELTWDGNARVITALARSLVTRERAVE